nr:hypothetical protein OG513_07745 [Streptomyces sp. NBC_00998]
MTELKGWVGRAGVNPAAVDGYAGRLYERIRRETANDAIAEARARDQSAALLDMARGDVSAMAALVRALQDFAKTRDDDTARRVYATISRFNLGEMFRPGGGADRYLIPYELADEAGE